MFAFFIFSWKCWLIWLVFFGADVFLMFGMYWSFHLIFFIWKFVVDSYATIKGAGHEAPGNKKKKIKIGIAKFSTLNFSPFACAEFQPLSAFQMVSRWIQNQNLSSPEDEALLKELPRKIRQSDVLRMRMPSFRPWVISIKKKIWNRWLFWRNKCEKV